MIKHVYFANYEEATISYHAYVCDCIVIVQVQ